MFTLCFNCKRINDSCTCGCDDNMPVPGTMIETIRILSAKGYYVIGCSDGCVDSKFGTIFISFGEQYNFESLPVGFEYAYETESGTSMVVNNLHLQMGEPIDLQKGIINAVSILLDWAITLPDVS